MDIKNIKLLVFDSDGLSFDSEKVYLQGWKYAFGKEGIPADEKWLETFSGKSAEDFHREFMDRYHDQALHDHLRQVREDFIYDSIHNGTLKPKPGLKEALDAAHKAGMKTALATSSPRKRVEDLLKTTGLDKDYDYVITKEDVKRTKPAPDPYLKALELAKVSPDQVIAFEDSKSGYLSAHAAGLYTIMIPDMIPIDPAMIEHGQMADSLHIVQDLIDGKTKMKND